MSVNSPDVLSVQLHLDSCLEMFKINGWIFFSTLFLDILVSWIPVHSQFVSFLIFITILGILPPTIYIIMTYHSIFQRSFVFKGLGWIFFFFFFNFGWKSGFLLMCWYFHLVATVEGTTVFCWTTTNTFLDLL